MRTLYSILGGDCIGVKAEGKGEPEDSATDSHPPG